MSFTTATRRGVFSCSYRECLHQIGRLRGQTLLLLNVVAHVAELLLQLAHRLKVRRMVEGVPPQKQELGVGGGGGGVEGKEQISSLTGQLLKKK